MKRKYILTIVAMALAISVAFCFVACNKASVDKQNNNVSRMTTSYYAGEDENYAVSIECGQREKCFIADGKAKDVLAFCELKVTPLKTNDCDTISYLVVGESATLSGSLARDEDNEFVALISLDFEPKSITLTINESNHEIDLCNILEGALGIGDIINIAKGEFADRIASENGGVLNREIYIKLITGDRINYYYYVSFIGEGLDYWALLVEPKTGSVISKK